MDVGFGSFATETRCPGYVRFSDSDHIADAPTRRKSANGGHSQALCHKRMAYRLAINLSDVTLGKNPPGTNRRVLLGAR